MAPTFHNWENLKEQLTCKNKICAKDCMSRHKRWNSLRQPIEQASGKQPLETLIALPIAHKCLPSATRGIDFFCKPMVWLHMPSQGPKSIWNGPLINQGAVYYLLPFLSPQASISIKELMQKERKGADAVTPKSIALTVTPVGISLLLSRIFQVQAKPSKRLGTKLLLPLLGTRRLSTKILLPLLGTHEYGSPSTRAHNTLHTFALQHMRGCIIPPWPRAFSF